MIRVLIADDHTLFREGVRALFANEGDIDVVAEAANGAEAVSKAIEHRPDVVLLDLVMPLMNGIEATKRIREACPDTKVLVLSMYDDQEYIKGLLTAGASGCILKHVTSTDLVASLRHVVSGGIPLDPQVAAKLVEDYVRVLHEHGAVPLESLSPREREILKLIAEGESNQLIAEQLGLSRKTVEAHRNNLMRKLDVHSVRDLVSYAVRQGVIRGEASK